MLFLILFLVLIIFVIHSIVPTYYNKLFNKNVLKKTKENNTIMLTFDDGPDSRYICNLVDVLEENDVKAIFFMVAENAKKNPEIVNMLLKKGHKIGIHSWQHKNAMLYTLNYSIKDFKNSINIMKDLGVDTLLYRPPWGHTNIFSNYFVKKYKMKMIYWNVMAEDWEEKAIPKTIVDKLLKRTEENSIICLHDAGENSGGAIGAPLKTIEALKIAIPKLKAKGYKFTVDVD